MITVTAFDRMTVTQRTITADGHMVAPAVLARLGTQEYYAYELGLDARLNYSPMRVVTLDRPEDEVFAPDSMASFEGVPVTVDHPEGNEVTQANAHSVTVGKVTGVTRRGDEMIGNVLITSADAIKAINAGKEEVSNGYSFSLDLTPGVNKQGQAFDGSQRNIRGNHVAAVDAGRCGSACRIVDSKPKGAKQMAVRKVTIDGIPFELDEGAAAAVDKLVGDRDALKNRAPVIPAISYTVGDKAMTVPGDKVASTLAEKDALIIAKDAQIAALQKDVMTPDARDAMVADWAKTINDGKRLMPALVTDGKTCLAIRREVLANVGANDARAKSVIDAVLGGTGPDAADEVSVRAAFNAVAATVEVQAANDAAMDRQTAAALLGQNADVKTGDADLTGTDLLAHRMANAWKTPVA